MVAEKKRRTFISYSSLNREFALQLARELRASGFNIWFDQLDIPTGSRWDDEVERALEECEIFMVILTPASSASDNVKDEIGYAIDTRKRILPVLLENATVPLRLRRFQYVDFRSKSYEEGFESAKRLLRNLTEEPTIPRTENPAVPEARKAKTDREAKRDAERIAERSADEVLAAKVDADELTKQKAGVDPYPKAKEEADRLSSDVVESDRVKASRENVIKASDLLKQGRKFFENKDWEKAVEKFQEVLTFTPNHAETKRLLADAEAQIVLGHKEVVSKTKEEESLLAAQKAEADKLAKQKTEDERVAKAKAEADRKAREAAEQKRLLEIRSEPVPSSTPQKKPLSKGLVAGIILFVVLCVAGIGFGINLLSNGNTQASNSPDISPSATNTQRPTNTPRPSPTPIPLVVFLNESDARAVSESGGYVSLVTLAQEQLGKEEFSTLLDNSVWIPVMLDSSEPTLSSPGGWCSLNADILKENLNHIALWFDLNGSHIPDKNVIYDYYTADDGWKCLRWYIVTDNWTTGVYNFSYGFSLEQEINDGENVHEPGTGISLYFEVTVP